VLEVGSWPLIDLSGGGGENVHFFGGNVKK
jgi:hypothetical protein